MSRDGAEAHDDRDVQPSFAHNLRVERVRDLLLFIFAPAGRA